MSKMCLRNLDITDLKISIYHEVMYYVSQTVYKSQQTYL